MFPIRPLELSPLWGLLIAAVICSLACSSGETSAPQAKAYTVKGRLEAVEPATNGWGILRIHHEAIADFRDESGAKVGMGVMTMPFAYGPGVDPAKLSVGGPVKMVFDMDYQRSPKLMIKSIEALPKGTSLTL